MKISSSTSFKHRLKKFTRRNKELADAIDTQLARLQKDPTHPSLRLHKLSGRKNEWSVSISDSDRMIVRYTDDGLLLIDLGSHDEVYSKK